VTPKARTSQEKKETVDVRVAAAVLIMVVTLLGGIFAVAQAKAGDRASNAARASRLSAIQLMGSVVGAGQTITAANTDFILAEDHDYLANRFGEEAYLLRDSTGPEASFASLLARMERSTAEHASRFSSVALDETTGKPDWPAYREKEFASAYRAAEFEKAWSAVSGDWARKGGDFVTILKIFVLALFLLGLSTTVVGRIRLGFMITGVAVALTGSVWGLAVWMQPVEQPSTKAIDAYVHGAVDLNAASARGTSDTEKSREELKRSIASFTTAVEARPDYPEAYLGRGEAGYELDLLKEDGPTGSQAALRDFRRAVSLGEVDASVWHSLSRAEWWLGDYDASSAALGRALALTPTELGVNADKAEALLVDGDTGGFRKQLAAVRKLIVGSPGWLVDRILEERYETLTLGTRFRPDIAAEETKVRTDLMDIHHEVLASTLMNGTPTSPPVDAHFDDPRFTTEEDRIVATVPSSNVRDGDQWMYRVYVDNGYRRLLSKKPSAWAGPGSGDLTIEIPTEVTFGPGTLIRVEVFVDGNLLSSGEFTLPE
jgi:tetratricopeptide (TPR) repeat protein